MLGTKNELMSKNIHRPCPHGTYHLEREADICTGHLHNKCVRY